MFRKKNDQKKISETKWKFKEKFNSEKKKTWNLDKNDEWRREKDLKKKSV